MEYCPLYQAFVVHSETKQCELCTTMEVYSYISPWYDQGVLVSMVFLLDLFVIRKYHKTGTRIRANKVTVNFVVICDMTCETELLRPTVKCFRVHFTTAMWLIA